ncbi:hypothetical protein ES702_00022 [subsurface metagenome]
MIYAAYENSQFKLQIEYIFNLILSIYGIKWQVINYSQLSTLKLRLPTIVISYGKHRLGIKFKHCIHIYESNFFGKGYLKPESVPPLPLKRFNGLPAIYYGCSDFDDFVRRSENLIETNIDIIASSFFILSRYEEIVLNKKDRFGRFPSTESLAYKEGFLNRPIVNEYIELLWKWIDSFALGFKRRKFWGDEDFAVCLTQDVDNVKKYKVYPPLLTIGSLALRHRDLRRVFATIVDYFKAKLGKDPYDNFGYIMKLEDKYGFKSSFYFMSGGNTKYDASYSINDSYITSLIKTLQEEGFEVGLHPSFNSYNNFRMLNLEKRKLGEATESAIFGGRQHYLRWKTPDTWRILEKAGLKYDTTLGFADREGFRCGICFPYKPFDVVENRVLNIWELPLIIMDRSLFNYQNLTPEEGFQRIKNLIDITKKYNGLFVLLWHNSSLDRLELPGWIQVYERTMEYIGKQDVFNNTAQGIIDWWEKK